MLFFFDPAGAKLDLHVNSVLAVAALVSLSQLSLLTGEKNQRRGCQMPYSLHVENYPSFTSLSFLLCPSSLCVPSISTHFNLLVRWCPDRLQSLRSCCGLVTSSWDSVCVCVCVCPSATRVSSFQTFSFQSHNCNSPSVFLFSLWAASQPSVGSVIM